MDSKPALFRLRHFSVQSATQQDLLAAQPVYHIGKGKLGKIGILCLHGFTVTPASYYEYSRVLIQKGYSVSVPLLPGHGDTPEALAKVKWPQWVDCAVESYQALREQCDRVFVIGISLGGALALQLASKTDDIAKLILLAPAIEPSLLFKIGKYLFNFLSLIRVQYWFHIAGDSKKPGNYEVGYKKTPISALRELYDCIQQTRLMLPEVRTNTLIFQSRIDHVINPKGAQLVYQKINTRNKELIWLTNSYHAIAHDFDGKDVLDRILEDIANFTSRASSGL